VARTGAIPPHDFHDPSPLLGEDVAHRTREFATASIATVRELVFPRPGVR